MRVCPDSSPCAICAEQAVGPWPRFHLFPRWDAFWKKAGR